MDNEAGKGKRGVVDIKGRVRVREGVELAEHQSKGGPQRGLPCTITASPILTERARVRQ